MAIKVCSFLVVFIFYMYPCSKSSSDKLNSSPGRALTNIFRFLLIKILIPFDAHLGGGFLQCCYENILLTSNPVENVCNIDYLNHISVN